MFVLQIDIKWHNSTATTLITTKTLFKGM